MTRLPFVKYSGLNSKTIVLLFVLKIAAGIAIGWISFHMYGTNNDYRHINRNSWEEYQLLWSDPKRYFTNLFTSGYAQPYSGFFDPVVSYWSDLKANIIIKMMSVFNFFSRGNYYINSLFFNSIVFLGHIALYRVFARIYKPSSLPLIIGCFLLPSTLYFSSGIHKDGMIFTAVCILFYALFNSLKIGISGKRIFIITVCLLFILLVRNYVFMLLFPALVAWIIAEKKKYPPLRIFLLIYSIAGITFLGTYKIWPSFNPLKIVTKKQSDYRKLPAAATAISLDTLYPTAGSFLHNAPQAFQHAFLRPYIIEETQPIDLVPLGIELFLYQALLVLCILNSKKRKQWHNPFIVMCIFFATSVLLFIGYIVPNLGSIVRYRSIYLPLLVTPLLVYSSEKFNIFKNKII